MLHASFNMCMPKKLCPIVWIRCNICVYPSSKQKNCKFQWFIQCACPQKQWRRQILRNRYLLPEEVSGSVKHLFYQGYDCSGNHKSANFEKIGKNMLANYQTLPEANMRIFLVAQIFVHVSFHQFWINPTT